MDHVHHKRLRDAVGKCAFKAMHATEMLHYSQAQVTANKTAKRRGRNVSARTRRKMLQERAF